MKQYILLGLTFIWLLMAQGTIYACAPYEYVGRTRAHYSFLKADKFYTEHEKWDSITTRIDYSINHPGLSVDFMGLSGYSDYDIMYDWTRYINNPNVHTEAIAQLIIPLKLEHWLVIDSFVQGIGRPPNIVMLENTFLKLLKTNGREDITRLIVFLKKVEPWWELDYMELYGMYQEGYYGSVDVYEKQRDGICQLLEEGKRLYAEETDRFLKMRYAHKLVRLASYTGNYYEAEAIFRSTFEDLPGNHAIEQWMLMQYAGVLTKLGKKPLANLYYLKVMASGSEKAGVAFNSIQIRTQQEWDATLALCTTPEEKNWLSYSFYQANRLVKPTNKIKILESILEETPNSDFGKFVAIQLINQLEPEMLPFRQFVTKSNNYRYENWVGVDTLTKSDVAKTIASLHQTLETALPRVRNTHKGFWQMINGYAYMLEGEHDAALPWLLQAQEQSKDKASKHYARLFIHMITMQQLSHIDAITEAELLPNIKWIEANFDKQAADYVYNILATKYKSQGDHTKALLLTCKDVCHDMELDRLDVTLPFMQIIKLREKKRKTGFETWLLANQTLTASNDELREFHLMRLLASYKFEEAAKHSCTFRSPYCNTYAFPSPFKLYGDNTIYQMSGWSEYEETNKRYNRQTFAWEMGMTMDSLKRFPKQKARLYLKLAKGMAHMQRNGGAWLSTAFAKTDGSWRYGSINSKAYKFNKQVVSLFYKAYRNTTDSELRAEALYGVLWYYNIVYDASNGGKHTNIFNDLKKQLYEEYHTTRYYQEIIRECERVYI